MSFNLIESAAGTLGSPGIVIIAPQTTTINSAPEESLISLIGKTCPDGAPFKLGSVEKAELCFSYANWKFSIPIILKIF